MAKDFQDILKEFVVSSVEQWGQSDSHKSDGLPKPGGMSGKAGLVLGAGAAALAPVALKQLAKRMGIESLDDLASAPGDTVENLTGALGDRVGSGIGDKLTDKLDEAGGPSGVLKDTIKGALSFGGGSGGDTKNDVPGVGKGRRMPVQQSVDIGIPIEVVYNQFTQFEEWPVFMHRVTRVTQEDETTLSFAVKIWGKTKEFTVELETQRPDQRIKWAVSQGMTHRGVVTFHELGPNLTRVLVGFDVEPGGMLEKAARGLRYVKRAARGDLHRFKAFIEMAEHETGAWRGVIEDGEVVEDHDPSYDEDREYSDIEDFMPEDEEQGDEDEQEDEQDEEEQEDEQDEQEEQEEQPARSRSRSSSRNGSSSSSGSSRSGRSGSASRGRQSESGGRSRSRSGSSGGGRTRSRGSNSSSSSSRSRSRGND